MRAFQIATVAVPIPLKLFGYLPQELENGRYALEASVTPMTEVERTGFRSQSMAGINK